MYLNIMDHINYIHLYKIHTLSSSLFGLYNANPYSSGQASVSFIH